MMKAARIHEYGAPLALEEVQTPEICPDEILVRVRAAALNPLDAQLRSGAMHGVFPLGFPYTPGTDLAGTVERAGASAARWRQGEAVVARTDPTKGGALAGFAVVPAAELDAAFRHQGSGRARQDHPVRQLGGHAAVCGRLQKGTA